MPKLPGNNQTSCQLVDAENTEVSRLGKQLGVRVWDALVPKLQHCPSNRLAGRISLPGESFFPSERVKEGIFSFHIPYSIFDL